jgi:spore coat polysaccharide biosynthesis protein SpsF
MEKLKLIDLSIWQKSHVVVQARMGSSRLPGKTLCKVGNQYLIDHVLKRLLSVIPDTAISVATTNLDQDDELEHHLQNNYSIDVYRGSPQDVQSRFLDIGTEKKAFYLVRVTADDPFKDPTQIGELIELIQRLNVDYVNNFSNHLFPIGLDLEVFTLKSLMDSRILFNNELNREHVTLALRQEAKYSRATLTGIPSFSNVRLTIDTHEDLEFCSKIALELDKTDQPYSFNSLYQILCKMLDSR